MEQLKIEVYAVSDQTFEDEFGNNLPIEELVHKLDKKFCSSYLKNKVNLIFIDVTKDAYDEKIVKETLGEGYLLPWTFFNGDLYFYNGFNISMIYKEALKMFNYKMVKRSINK